VFEQDLCGLLDPLLVQPPSRHVLQQGNIGESVALFERIVRDRNITVIGARQDDMERYALEASGLYIKLRSSDAIAHNEPPIVVGDEASRGRVKLLAEWLSSYWPAAAPDLGQSSEPDNLLMDFG
jgi:hypothetical protein